MTQYQPKWNKNLKLENGLSYQYFSEFFQGSVEPKKGTQKMADLIHV